MANYFHYLTLLLIKCIAALPIDYYADKQLGSYIFKYVHNVTYVNNTQLPNSPHLGVELKNGLKILFMNDPAWTNQISLDVDVNIGYLANFSPGTEQITHIIEHLFFRGNTTNNASDSDLISFVRKRNGQMGGATLANHTIYTLSILKDFFGMTLNKLVEHLTAPNLSHEYITKEFVMVTDEYVLRLKNYDLSFAQVWNASQGLCTSNRSESMLISPASANLTEQVQSFFHKYYQPHLMTVVVRNIQATSKDIMKTVLKKFGPLKNTNKINRFIIPTQWKPVPSMVQYILNSDQQLLNVYFAVPFNFPYKKYHFSERVSAALNERRPDSFIETVKFLGLATAVTARNNDHVSSFVRRPVELFSIVLDLTDDGVKSHEKILELLFTHLIVIRNFSHARWSEVYAVNPQLQPENVVFLMHDHPLENVVQESYTADFYLEVHNSIMAYLNSSNFFYQVTANKFQGKKLEEVCGNYNFTMEPIRQKLIEHCNPQLNDSAVKEAISFSLPKATLLPTLSRKPVLIFNETAKNLWHKFDQTESMKVEFLLRTSSVDFNQARNILLKNILHLILFNIARSSGHSAIFEKHQSGFIVQFDQLSIGGATNALQFIFSHFKLDHESFFVQDRFNSNKKFILSLNDRLSKETLYTIGPEYFATWADGDFYAVNETALDECQNATLMDVIHYTKTFFAEFHIDCLITGDVLKSEALSIFRSAVDAIVHQFSTKPGNGSISTINIPPSFALVYKTVINEVQSVTIVGFWVDKNDFRAVAAFKLLFNLLSAETSFKLRMVEYLGYVPAFEYINALTGDYASFRITGFHNSDNAVQKIEELVQSLKKIISSMSKKIFHSTKTSVLAEHMIATNVAANHWNAIKSGTNNFDSWEQYGEEMNNMTKETMLNVIEDYLMPSAPKFKKLILQINNDQKHVLAV